jgi:pyruvate/2-oxoglutarate dehydrogenase complex dihydrolipoamide acyltransferase (E2) component
MSRAIERTTVASVAVVAAVAGVISYSHMHDLAVRSGEGWHAWLIPFAVDGLVVAASMTMVVRKRHGRPGGLLAWVGLVAGIGASVAANALSAEPTLIGRVVAAWPSVALLVAYELLMDQVKTRVDLSVAAPVERHEPEPVSPPVAALVVPEPEPEPEPAAPVPPAPAAPSIRALAAQAAERSKVEARQAARQAAREHYLDVLQRGDACTGKELGEQFRMSERWGRAQINAVKAERELVGAK